MQMIATMPNPPGVSEPPPKIQVLVHNGAGRLLQPGDTIKVAMIGDKNQVASWSIPPLAENLPMKEFVPEVIERCGKADLLFPLLNFLVRSVDKITAMEFKRYDSSNFQKFRAQATQGVEDPTLEDVVLGILRFMRAHQIGEVPSPDSQRSVRHV